MDTFGILIMSTSSTAAPATRAELLASLQKHRGRIAPTSRELGCSRAWIHEQVNGDPALAKKLASIRSSHPSVQSALEKLVIDPDEVAVRALGHEESHRASVLAVIVDKVAEVTGLPKREVATRLDHARHGKALARLLPEPPPDPGPKKAVQVATSHENRAWLLGKPKGTVPALLAATDKWPKVNEPTVPTLFHTSYLMPTEVHDRLVEEAQHQTVSVSALIRAILNRAESAAQHAPSARRLRRAA